MIYEDGSSPPVHVSGHASQEELKLIMNLVKPRYLVPIHGEYRQLRLHADLARSLHGAVGQVLLLESGDVLEFDELGARKIRVNSINPGMVESEGTHTAGFIGSDFQKNVEASAPLGRIGQPDDVAKVAVFLASDDSAWLTGERISASGGHR